MKQQRLYSAVTVSNSMAVITSGSFIKEKLHILLNVAGHLCFPCTQMYTHVHIMPSIYCILRCSKRKYARMLFSLCWYALPTQTLYKVKWTEITDIIGISIMQWILAGPVKKLVTLDEGTRHCARADIMGKHFSQKYY